MYRIIPQALTGLEAILERFQADPPAQKNPLQTGFGLGSQPWVYDYLKQLETIAEEHWGHPAQIMLDRCSCRKQEPDQVNGLAFHQDIAACAVKHQDDKRLVFWVPLVPIDEYTPTLALCTDEVPYMAHVTDQFNYSVLQNQVLAGLFNYVAMKDMAVGDVVMFDAATVHATLVMPGMTKTRWSLDVRLRPA